MAGAPRQVFELKACGSDDPDGSRTASVLGAYLHAEHMKAFCRLLWRRLAVGTFMWVAIALTTSLLSRRATLTGFLIVAAVACWAAFLEWSADHRLRASLADLPSRVAETSDAP